MIHDYHELPTCYWDLKTLTAKHKAFAYWSTKTDEEGSPKRCDGWRKTTGTVMDGIADIDLKKSFDLYKESSRMGDVMSKVQGPFGILL